MIELLHQIEQIDTQIFLFFNGFHNVYWDYFMMIFSDRFVWVPFYASFIFVLLKNFPVKVVMSTIVVITLIILFSEPDCIRNSEAISSKNASQQS